MILTTLFTFPFNAERRKMSRNHLSITSKNTAIGWLPWLAKEQPSNQKWISSSALIKISGLLTTLTIKLWVRIGRTMQILWSSSDGIRYKPSLYLSTILKGLNKLVTMCPPWSNGSLRGRRKGLFFTFLPIFLSKVSPSSCIWSIKKKWLKPISIASSLNTTFSWSILRLEE